MGIVIVLLHLLQTASTPVPASEHCHPIADLRRAYAVVLGNSKQMLLRGHRAQRYLDEYNRFPPPSRIIADDLLLIVMPSGAAIMVPIGAGIGCKRIIISPQLHRIIMLRIGRDDT